jgi:hypothetical protein
MRPIITLLVLFSISTFSQTQEDSCSSYETKRQCESVEAVAKKCKWLKSKEICKNEDIIKTEASKEKTKGLSAIKNESIRPAREKKTKDKKKP